MNNILGKIVNSKKLTIGIVAAGFALSTLGNILSLVGVYYAGIKKGVEVRVVEED